MFSYQVCSNLIQDATGFMKTVQAFLLKRSDLETRIGTSLLYLMKGKRLVGRRWIVMRNLYR